MRLPACLLRAGHAPAARFSSGLPRRGCCASLYTTDAAALELPLINPAALCGDVQAAGTAPKTADAMKIIAVTNIKGGVGKTTTAVNLSYLCAASGRPTLLWDLDPQGAATYTLRGEPQKHASPKKLLGGKRQLPELILPTEYP